MPLKMMRLPRSQQQPHPENERCAEWGCVEATPTFDVKVIVDARGFDGAMRRVAASVNRIVRLLNPSDPNPFPRFKLFGRRR